MSPWEIPRLPRAVSRVKEEPKAKEKPKAKAEVKPAAALPIEIGEAAPEEPKSEEKPKPKPKKHFKKQQGFFFDMIETPMVGPDAASDGKEAGDVHAQ